MPVKKLGIGAALAGSAVAIVLGSSAYANAGTTTPTTGATSGYAAAASPGRGGSSHTVVTGVELTKVTAAMKAKDPTVTVTAVRKDADGSYDVLGTKAGAPVVYDVTADLTTFTARTGGPGGGGCGHGCPDRLPSGSTRPGSTGSGRSAASA